MKIASQGRIQLTDVAKSFVTLIVPFRNEEVFLERCVRSLLELDFPAERYEIILSDDGSTDNSVPIARELASQFPTRIRVLVGSAVHGPGPTVNAAVAAAEGDICTVIAADAFVEKNYLNAIISGFDDAEVGAVIPFVKYVRGEWGSWSVIRTSEAHGFVAFRRNVFNHIGGYDPRFLREVRFLGRHMTFFRREDTDFLLSLRDGGYRVISEKNAVSYHEVYSDSLRLVLVLGLDHMMDVLLLKKHPLTARKYLRLVGSSITLETFGFLLTSLSIVLLATFIRSGLWLLATGPFLVLSLAYVMAARSYSGLCRRSVLRPFAVYAYLAASFAGRIYGSITFGKLLL